MVISVRLLTRYLLLLRFGRWELTDTWSDNRGPDPMFEYQEFRSNILDNLQDTIFNKPLCEVMHNQKYFNGIGNYLRAEIIFRSVRCMWEAQTVIKWLA